jgi:predicted transglutaminase-like cysteine proteinase
MRWFAKRIFMAGIALAGSTMLALPTAMAGPERPLFASVGPEARPPIGWVQFCNEQRAECDTGAGPARDIVLTAKAWNDLVRINQWVNDNVKPVTDLEQWGVVERWSYPDNGYGDCEDYVLLKRQMLVKAGWPRSALLITVVRDKKGDGHAVLTVKTDKGEFVLDNQNEAIVLWSESGYRFVKRQSQSNQNLWVALGDSPAALTATAR